MKRISFALLLLVAAQFAHAADPVLLTEARRAVAESVPQVAAQKLRTLLAQGGLSPEIRAAAERELGVALFAGGQLDEALATVAPLAGAGDAAAQLLQAEVLASLGRWSEAMPLFEKLSAQSVAPAAARLGYAEGLVALGRKPEAVTALEAFVAAYPEAVPARLRLAGLLIDAGDFKQAARLLGGVKTTTAREAAWKRYLEGRRLLGTKQLAEAQTVFEGLLKDPKTLDESLSFGASLGLSDAILRQQGAVAADTPLEQFISRSPESPYLEAAFQRLDQIYSQQTHATDSELKQWSKDGTPRIMALARFYGARLRLRAGNPEGAGKMLNLLIDSFPESPLIPTARLVQADVLLGRGDLAGAVQAIEAAERLVTDESQRAEIELRKALVHYRQGEWLLAANSFHRAAERSPALRANATFDAALTALALRNYDGFFADYQALSAAAPESPLRSVLLLEQGLSQARAGDARATETLDLFIHHFPKHPRQGEARLALAELAFAAQDRAGAARYLRAVNEAAPERDMAEHSAYLAIFLAADAVPQKDAEVIEKAKAFLKDYPTSSLLPEVRMKLGQLYVRAGDHANAETQFTLLAQEQPVGPHAEAALFLAGQSATRVLNAAAVDRALTLFSEVVKREGPLKLYARQQQAILQGKLGNPGAAIDVYNSILKATPAPEQELRSAALCGKGDSLLLLGRQDPKQVEAALAVFGELAAMPGVTSTWRNQALYKTGQALKNLGRTEEALAAWYDVLDKAAPDDRDYFWYYKAGFDAADLFRSQQQWKSAVGVYEKMARVPGPRAAEAKQLAAQLKLEKFLWE